MTLIFSLPTNLPFYAIYPELFVASKTGKYSLFELVKKLCHVHSEANTAFKFLKTILEVYFITSPRNIDSMIHITGDFLCKWSLDKPENLKEKNSLGGDISGQRKYKESKLAMNLGTKWHWREQPSILCMRALKNSKSRIIKLGRV